MNNLFEGGGNFVDKLAQAVLGIDAAWTATRPSGVALAVKDGAKWRLVRAQSSYQRFLAAASGAEAEPKPTGCLPDIPALLAACAKLHAGCVDLVAIDMPLSLDPITSRRVSDNLVSKAYGARYCGTHTPSATRPGRLSDALRIAFDDAGYPLLTSGCPQHGLIEVYPHPALVELAAAKQRLPYKISKTRTYWPGLIPVDRKAQLFEAWSQIVTLLDTQIAGTAVALPLPPIDAPGIALKAYEDQIDAVVCAWVGACALDGGAIPYGDSRSAIWIPHPKGQPQKMADFAPESMP